MSGPVYEGEWINGEQTLSGRWQYMGSDRFAIALDSVDPLTDRRREFTVTGESPEWDGWKLKRTQTTGR